MNGPPFNFNIKVIQGDIIVFINGDHVVKIEYAVGTEQVTVSLSDGSKEVLYGNLAKEIIARCEGIAVKTV